MNKVTYHAATTQDIDTLWRWGKENWELWGDGRYKWFSKKSLKRWITEPEDDVLLVAKDGGRVIGMCMVNVMRDWAFCFGLFVDKSYRGKGIGKELIATAAKLLRKHHVESLQLIVDIKNTDAVAFYEREGFYKGYQFFYMTKVLEEAT